jgi:hypothetical protein
MHSRLEFASGISLGARPFTNTRMAVPRGGFGHSWSRFVDGAAPCPACETYASRHDGFATLPAWC